MDLSAVMIGYTDTAPKSFVRKLKTLGADPQPLPALPEMVPSALGVESSSAFDYHIAPGGDLPPIPQGLTEAEERNFTRFRRGRDQLGMDYVHSQRRRLIVMKQMAKAMDGFDMFVTGSGEVGLTNQTGHPAAVVQYGFGLRDPDDTDQNPQPLTTTIVGDLFADDQILSVAHAFQVKTDWHTRHPSLD